MNIINGIGVAVIIASHNSNIRSNSSGPTMADDEEPKKQAGTSLLVGDMPQVDDIVKNEAEENAQELAEEDAAATALVASKTEDAIMEMSEEISAEEAIAMEEANVSKSEATGRPVVHRPRDKNDFSELVLSFDNIVVHVPEKKKKQCCKCIDNPIRTFSQEYMGVGVAEADAFYSLDLASGYLRTGEMCLVLGSSDVAKSTLLRFLCGRLNVSDEVSGSLLLNGMPLGRSNQGWRRMTPYVAASDSSHAPVLTVRETFTFAAQCTSDGKQNPQAIQDEVDRLMQVLGLDHVADTVVGDENLRGVSGGQKRRVTVGEMLTDPGSRFFCLENITDGLASTDSMKIIDALAKACRKYELGGFVSLLQPSDEIVSLFDKLMVLTANGEMSYFGPIDVDTLRTIFLGPDVSADVDHGSICDLVLSQPDDSAVVKRFRDSETYKDLVNDLTMIRSQAPPARDRNVDLLLPDKKYSTSRSYQFRILARRKLKLIARNAITWTRVIIAIVFGIIIGSLFSVLKNDLAGSLARTGYLFLNSFLVLMLSSAITIPDAFRQRVTLFKHRSAEFFSGRVAYLVQIFLDMPLSILEAFLLASISYYWVEMNPGADNFFYFVGALIGLECVGQSYARLLSALIRKQVSASAVSSISILICATVGGFMPNYESIPWVLRWLSWLTPVSYAFEGLMINEFAGRQIQGISLVAENGEATDGSFTGEAWLNMYNLPRAAWGSLTSIKIFDLFMLFVFAVVYDFFGFYYVEHTRGWSSNESRRPQSRVRSDYLKAGASGTKGSSHTSSFGDVPDGEAQDPQKHSFPETLAVRNLVYTVPLKRKKKWTVHSIVSPCLVRLSGKEMEKVKEDEPSELTLLNDVDACFRRGRMTALMGPSGCGKTTLMDVIAGYKTGGKISGDILIDGQPKNDAVWKKLAGYAEQLDILNPYLSVMETLRFTAICRLSLAGDIDGVVDEVIRLMGLESWTDMIIGREREGEGLPKHARKRLTIAVQLVGQPRILFLDEPTTGLGTTDASRVIKAIRRSTDHFGLITLATIHQPSMRTWGSFDDVLLLTKGGRVAYMGEMGPHSQSVLSHFASVSKKEPPTSCNPADFVLECLTSVSIDTSVAAFETSPEKEDMTKQIEGAIGMDKTNMELPDTGRAISPFMEVFMLFKRHIITQWRNPSYSFMRLICCVGSSIYMGILFFGNKTDSISGAVSSIGAVFFFVFILVIPMQAGVIPLVEDRAVLYRETVSGIYSRFSYGLGMLLADIPFHMLNAGLMFVSFYYLVDFGRDGNREGYFVLMTFIANFVIMSLGQLYALATPNEESANGVAGLTIILSVILMGFLITVDSMPNGWVWAYWTNLLRYMLQGLVTNELAGTTYKVDLSPLLPNVTGLSGASAPSQLVVYGPGIEPASDATAQQASSFLGLVSQTGGGVNTQSSLEDLGILMDCLITNECLLDPVLPNLFTCVMFNPIPGRDPVCKDEFEKGTEGLNLTEIVTCFDEPDNSTDTIESNGRPTSFTLDTFNALADDDQLDLILCLLRAVLPPDLVAAIESLIKFLEDNFDIIIEIIDIIQNGLQLPGELILYFFGWAEFQDGELVAPWKWWYCMSSVAIFWAGIESLKILAVTFVVWITR